MAGRKSMPSQSIERSIKFESFLKVILGKLARPLTQALAIIYGNKLK
jgi:hypothetical protein